MKFSGILTSNELQWFDIFSIDRNIVDGHPTNVNYIYDWLK